jgi:hypothetical protein
MSRHGDLRSVARQAMLDRGLQPDFSEAAQREVCAIAQAPARVRDVAGMGTLNEIFETTVLMQNGKDRGVSFRPDGQGLLGAACPILAAGPAGKRHDRCGRREPMGSD